MVRSWVWRNAFRRWIVRPLSVSYVGAVWILAATGLALGVPRGALAGTAYARFASGVLNLNLTRPCLRSRT